MIRLFVSDLDGTLLNDQHVLSEENRKAVQLLRSKGISFMPASGRDYHGVQMAIEESYLQPKAICLNGAEFYDNDGKLLISNPLSKESVAAVQAVIDKYELDADYYTSLGRCILYGGDDLKTHLIERIKKAAPKEMREDPLRFMERIKFFDTLIVEKTIEGILERTILKIETRFDDLELREQVLQELETIEGIITTSSSLHNLEINSIEATKGHMIEQVCETYGYKKEEVIVIGDGMNDIPMLERFPNSYAMGQAPQAVKDVAKFETDSNANDGVAKLIYKILAEM